MLQHIGLSEILINTYLDYVHIAIGSFDEAIVFKVVSSLLLRKREVHTK